MTTPPQPPPGDPWQNAPGMSPEQPQQQPGWNPPPPPGAGPGYGYGGGPGYGAAPGYGGGPATPSNGLGVAALVLGILGILTSLIFVGALLGIVAIVLGFVARGKAKRGEATNGGVAMAGIVTGALAVAGTVLFIALLGSLFGKNIDSYNECVREAGNDQTKVERCAEDYVEDTFGS